MGRVLSVDYRKIFDLGDFKNERIGVALEVDENEEPGAVMRQAVDFVNAEHERLNAERRARLTDQQAVWTLQRRRDDLDYECRKLVRSRVELLSSVEQLIKVLQVHGVDVSDIQAAINYAPLTESAAEVHYDQDEDDEATDYDEDDDELVDRR